MSKTISFSILVLAMGGCATFKGAPDKVSKPDVPKDQLSARSLAPGECGLFVWKADAEKRFILFSQSQNETAIWTSGPGQEQALTIVAQSGRAAQNQYPVQTYEPVNLQLTLREGQAITDGTRYKAGTLTQRADGEWDRVTPVVGLSTCKPL